MLWMMLEGWLEVHGEPCEIFAVFNDGMAECQFSISVSHQAIGIPFRKTFKPHFCVWTAWPKQEGLI
jgi:hypothetical protein